MPVDLHPVAGGNLGLVEVLSGRRHLEIVTPTEAVRWQSHFVTCPHAGAHRRKREKQQKPVEQRALEQRQKAAWMRRKARLAGDVRR